jgi:hypothetical protein
MPRLKRPDSLSKSTQDDKDKLILEPGRVCHAWLTALVIVVKIKSPG